jgi:ParB-like chromosome segregation protein Spo0J
MNDTHDDSGNWRLIDIEPPVLGGVLYHPLAEAFRLLEGAELDALADDIKANGLHDPLVLYENEAGQLVILEGRNRYRACLKVGVEPRWQRFIGDAEDARAFVISRNDMRRHDNAYLRAKAKRALMTLKWGGDRRSAIKPENLRPKRTVTDIVALREVTRSAIEQVGRIEKAHPMIESAVAMGVITLGKADSLAKKSDEDQQAVVDQWLGDAVRKKSFTPEQRERWARRRKLAPTPKKEIDPVRQSSLMTAIKLADWNVREFVFKKLWEMFGPAMRARLIQEVIGPDRQAQFGFADGGDEARYSGDIAEDRG